MKILAINPGSLSTKIAVYKDLTCTFEINIHHTAEEVDKYTSQQEQFDYRKKLILKTLADHLIPFDFDVIIGRGGLLQPTESGVYELNERVYENTKHPIFHHPCNLGSLLAFNMAQELPHCKPLTADPGVVDEMNDLVRFTGSPLLPRIAIWHALNQRAIARRFAREHQQRYENLNLIIAHLGGGISITAHDHGRAVDTNNALNGDGPFTPTRAGTLPTRQLIDLCYSGKFTCEQLQHEILYNSGLKGYLGTYDVPLILKHIEEGDEKSKKVVDAMCYQIAKFIGSQAPVLYGKVDAILITGSLAKSAYITDKVKERVNFLAPVYIYPGENEMEALAQNAYMAMKGELPIKQFK